jgi:hypothetical protein
VLALAEWEEGNKGLCREIISDDASKKTSLLQHSDSYSKLSKLGTWRRIQRPSLHSFPKFFFKFFILCHAMRGNKNMLWRRSK